jgi:cell division protein FtsL
MEPKLDDSWITHALRRAPWRAQTQTTSLVVTVVVTVLVIGALYLAQATRTATAGRRLQELEYERRVLEQQNAQLRAEIAALRSVPRLISEAEKLGYRMADSSDVEYLVVEGLEPVVQVVATPPEPVSPAEDIPAYEETLESWLRDRFTIFQEQMSDFIEDTFKNERTEGRP